MKNHGLKRLSLSICMSTSLQVNGAPITVAVGSLLEEEGFSLVMSPESAESIWRTLLQLGAVPMGPAAWERLRILNGEILRKKTLKSSLAERLSEVKLSAGRPAPGKELTDDYNVLEAGLWRTISLDKGLLCLPAIN